ncbi:MAG: DUF1365 domain-containing protein, partial [Verrucomicrobiota bacterium]
MSPSAPPSGAWRSCLYECSVMHHRLAPREHRFRHGLFLACLDLDELELLTGRLWLFGWNRPRLYSFRDADHLALPGRVGLRASLEAWLAGQGQTVPPGSRIVLVTLPRILGYVFNPVSFYFVTGPGGAPVCAVAEVGNTFGELKPYLVPVERPGGRAGAAGAAEAATAPRFRVRAPKHFYVSPFSSLELEFDFHLRQPGERLEIGVNDVTPEGRLVL